MVIKEASYIMQATATCQAVTMREEAAEKYNDNMEKVRNLRERAEEVRWRRQEEEEEKKRAAEAIVTSPPKPVVMVAPTLVLALKFQLQAVEEVVQPVT